jgi:hypothetical protein
MLRAVSQKNRPARVGHRIPSGKLGQSQIQIRTKASELLRLCQKCVLGRAPAAVARRLACPRCLPLAVPSSLEKISGQENQGRNSAIHRLWREVTAASARPYAGMYTHASVSRVSMNE